MEEGRENTAIGGYGCQGVYESYAGKVSRYAVCLCIIR